MWPEPRGGPEGPCQGDHSLTETPSSPGGARGLPAPRSPPHQILLARPPRAREVAQCSGASPPSQDPSHLTRGTQDLGELDGSLPPQLLARGVTLARSSPPPPGTPPLSVFQGGSGARICFRRPGQARFSQVSVTQSGPSSSSPRHSCEAPQVPLALPLRCTADRPSLPRGAF